MRPRDRVDDHQIMLIDLSNQLADIVAAAAPSVVQVQGRRRPASGLVYAEDIVVTTVRVLGREDGLRVRRHDGETLDAELAGWDPARGLAALRVRALQGQTPGLTRTAPRVGQLAVAVGRSWSGAVTASAGIVSIIGGPLPTGRHRAIERVIRTSAPMHAGFAGGAFLDAEGNLIGMATGTEIRGLGVVIPAEIAWQAAASVLAQGGMRRGYLGIAGQAVRLPGPQREASGPGSEGEAMLVVAITERSPAEKAGLLVGDVVVAFDGEPIASPEDLLQHLTGDRVGRQVPLRVLRGGVAMTSVVTVGERPRRSP